LFFDYNKYRYKVTQEPPIRQPGCLFAFTKGPLALRPRLATGLPFSETTDIFLKNKYISSFFKSHPPLLRISTYRVPVVQPSLQKIAVSIQTCPISLQVLIPSPKGYFFS
jgi:hypothetical protein